VPPVCPEWKHFCTLGEYFTISNSIFNFNFLALAVSAILGGVPNLHCKEILYVKRVLHNIKLCFNFNFLALVLSEILGGPKFTLGGSALP